MAIGAALCLAPLCVQAGGRDAVPGGHPGQAELVREVAAETGQAPATLNALLDRARYQPTIIEAITRPAESKPWSAYRPIFLTARRIHDGVDFYLEHRALIERIARQYHVAPSVVVAILGVETSYGRITGHYRVLDALVTLGLYYPPRAAYFRKQLKTLLELPPTMLAGPVDTLTGSYAGAQGWGQFMPDSIRDYAVDEDGAGRIDLDHSLPDILASVANYFHKHGWLEGGPLAVRTRPDAHASALGARLPLEQLQAMGYAVPASMSPGTPASVQVLAGGDGPEYWLTFHNFYVITRYNRSPLYAMAVTQLAAAIADGVARAERAARVGTP